MEITQSGQQTENRIKKLESNIRDIWDNIKRANLRIIGIPEGVEKDKGMENIFEEIITGNFPNLKDTGFKVQEAQRAPNKLNPNRPTPLTTPLLHRPVCLLRFWKTTLSLTAKNTPFVFRRHFSLIWAAPKELQRNNALRGAPHNCGAPLQTAVLKTAKDALLFKM